ncbi:PKD domain-containing protein [Parapedobacter sp. 10938]|uniref:PKD domain-containing protein n=1 Tax=Parapedobacter flavus TaxID=3110225 RepID=UPI002DBBCB29|nr:PKD domain-containing protein [Parapedobacter sp. 10938]MEC3881813.1 PKD domain-containing protein [Parapedobacter sp. 10938]
MRRIALFALCVSGTASLSCSDREDTIQSFNTPPEIHFVSSADSLTKEMTDSIRYYEDSPSYYTVSLKLADPNENLWKCAIVLDSGKVTGYYNGMEMERPSVRVDQEFVDLSLSPKQTGNTTIHFVAEDSFNQTSTATLNLFAFRNLPPVAQMDNRQVNGYEYAFDATRSHDADERFGGEVVAYEYNISGSVFTTPQPVVYHVFSGAGTYTVSLRVMDNDGDYSEPLETQIIIN